MDQQNAQKAGNTPPSKLPLALLCLAAIFATGCTNSWEAAADTRHSRNYLTDDLEDMIMLNLMRAKNGMPFIHYDVATVQGVVTSQVAGTLSAGQSLANTSTRQTTFSPITSAVTAVASTLTGVATRPLTFSLSPSRNNALTLAITPVYEDPTVYGAYVKFLNLRSPTIDRTTAPAGSSAKTKSPNLTITGFDADITSIVSQPKPPAEGKYVKGTLKNWEGSYYYIPIEYRGDFSSLSISVVARNPPSDSATQQKISKNTESNNHALTNISNALLPAP